MIGGVIILLLALFGLSYFLYQKIRYKNIGGIMTGKRKKFTNFLYKIFHGKKRNTIARNQLIASAYNSVGNRQLGLANNSEVNRNASNRPLVPASRDNITETGPMVYFANDRHGRSDREYRFNYKKIGGSWRAYILRMPSLEGRSNESSTIHRLHDNGGYYICWDSSVNTLKDMQNVSRRWADCIQAYITTGRFG